MHRRVYYALSVIAALAVTACSGRGAGLSTGAQSGGTDANGADAQGSSGGGVSGAEAGGNLGDAQAGVSPSDTGAGISVLGTDDGGTALGMDGGGPPGTDASAFGGDGGATPTPACVATCGTHRWACWPMPNPPASGLPNPARYLANADGTVTDAVTCLIWQKTVSASTYTVTQGRAYCASLGAGWRIATRIELTSIDDFTQGGATIDPAAFPGTPSDFFKTGSEWALATKQIGSGRGTDFGWALNFSDGTAINNLVSASTPNFVRCARGGGDGDLDTAPGALAVAPPNQYSVIATGEVKDNYTGLIWQRGYSSAMMAWADAGNYCATLGANGHTWRVPSIRELSTLVDESQVAAAINRTMFPGTKWGANNWYWASHRAVNSSAAWAINYDDGFTAFNAGAAGAPNYFTAAWVRCVR